MMNDKTNQEQQSVSEVLYTQPQRLLIERSAEILQYPPAGKDIVFLPSVMTQVSMPRSQYNGREFTRKNGDAWITIQAGRIDEGCGPIVQPVPYGPMPRLAMSWITSYAKRNKTREIFIGNSAAEFLSFMGMSSDGHRYKTLRKQMHALAACRMQMGYRGRTFNGTPINQFDAWSRVGNGSQGSLWPGTLGLSEDYYKVIDETAVPLDLRAMMALKSSALALDIYFWLAHRLHRLQGRPVLLHWKKIREQFAVEYTTRDFKKKFLPALHKVKQAYPQALVEPVKTGLLLRASPPPIKYKE